MRRADVIAVAQGALVGALVAGAAVLIWTIASGQAGFPTTAAALRSPFLLPTPTPRAELPIALESGGLGLASFGEDGDATLEELEGFLGTPNGDEHWTCSDPAGEVHFAQWADFGVFVINGVFVGWVDAIHFPPEFGPLLELKTTEDLHIGVELEHFEAHLGDRFVIREPAPDAVAGAAREFDIDGTNGIHGLVEDGAEGSRVVALWAGTTCFENGP